MEQGDLLVHEEGVRNPDLLDIFSTNDKLLDSEVLCIEGESWVRPELSKVHVEREVHELLRQVSDGEDVERDAHSDGYPPIVGPHPPVVPDLEGVEQVGDVQPGVGGERETGVGPGGGGGEEGGGDGHQERER